MTHISQTITTLLFCCAVAHVARIILEPIVDRKFRAFIGQQQDQD